MYAKPSFDQYKIFWCEFPENLQDWLKCFHIKVGFGSRPIVHKDCSTTNVAELHQLDADLMRVVYFWVNATIKGYIIEFVAEDLQSFSRSEAILLKEIPLWIKVLMGEEHLLPFQENKIET